MSIKLVDNQYVYTVSPHPEKALIMPLAYAVALGTFLKLTGADVHLDELPY